MFKKILALSMLCGTMQVQAGNNGDCSCNDTNKDNQTRSVVIPVVGPCTPNNLFISPTRAMYTNHINPVKTVIDSDQQINCSSDECGVTCFSGNVGVIRELRVNSMSPLSNAFSCGENTAGTSCFHGSFAIDPNIDTATLLVNQINPVKSVGALDATGRPLIDPCTQQQALTYVADDSCTAATQFNGNVSIRDARIFGQIDNISLSEDGTAVLQLTFNSSDFVNNIAPGGFLNLDIKGAAHATYDYETIDFGVASTTELIVFPSSCYCHNNADHTISCEQNNKITIESSVYRDLYNSNELFIFLTIAPGSGVTNATANVSLYWELKANGLASYTCLPTVDVAIEENSDICS